MKKIVLIAMALSFTSYLALCWHIRSIIGDFSITEKDDYQTVLAKIGPPSSIMTDINVGARWRNFRASGWELTVQTEGYRFEPADPIDFAAVQRVFILDEYYVECELPDRNGGLIDFLAAPTRCRILLRA